MKRIILGVIAIAIALALTPTTASAAVAEPPAQSSRQVTVVAQLATIKWWTNPLPNAACSSPFGWRTFYDTRLHKWRSSMHWGRDLLKYYRAPIVAAANGTVVQAGWRGDYGYAVEIQHGKPGTSTERRTLYGHLNSITVRKGQWVRMGVIIGRLGSTGDATGNHLHFEFRLRDGTRVNPDTNMQRRGVAPLCR